MNLSIVMQKIRSTFAETLQWWEKQQAFVLFTCNMIIFSEQKAKDKGVGAVKVSCRRRDGQLGTQGDPRMGHGLTKGAVP